ncbi:coiled-coil domain-containing protein AGAP005037-like isoform X4 [Centruroides vittatus]|uniref:coiled-coil domain-containing protein AGAP005037-like isoform X4 n=1 Tax=Centruroides vittatus TaxID=120091 RepID=UPI00350EBDFF
MFCSYTWVELVVEDNQSDTDWPIEESQSTSSSSGGGIHSRARHQALPHPNVPTILHSPSGGQRLEAADGHRPSSSQAMKRSQVRRHHTITSEHPMHAPPPAQRSNMDIEGHFAQRNPQFYQPPASVYDDDPGIMSEVETSATGFRRGNKIRSTLPVIQTPSKTQEHPLEMSNEPQYAGLVFLQYRSETKRALLPNEITTLDTIKALFVRSFPKQLTMEYLDSPHIRIYIHDPSKDMFYELEDLRDVRDRSVLRIYERDVNGGEAYSTWEQDVSYFSEPEFDSEYQNQHIHRSKVSKSSMQPPGYYGRVSPYAPSNISQTLPHRTTIRCYSPTPSERHKTQTLHPPGPVMPPPKPQRSFQQGVPVLPITPPPPGPPPSIPSPRSVPSYPMERRHEPQGAYLAPPDRIYPTSGQSPYQPSPEHRYEHSYHSSPDRSNHDLGYLSSPEHRYDHQQSFPIYGNSSFEEQSYYGERMYGSRSGSVTPVVDEQTRLRVEHMERQLANLTGLVQKALSTGPPPRSHSSQQIPTRDTESQHTKEKIEKGYSSEREEAEPEIARQLFKEEKSVSFSDETTNANSCIPKQHSPQHAAERPAKPAIKTSTSLKSQSSENEVIPTTSSTTVMPAEREGRPSSGKPAPPPKPASLSSALLEVKQHGSFSSKEFHLNPELYTQLRQLRKQTKDLKLEVRNLRRVAQAQAVTAKETVRDTCLKIKAMIASVQVGEDQNNVERQRISQEEELYRQDVTKLEKDLSELENQVEELRGNVINRRCRVNISDVESMALVLSRASKNVADLKARFPNLQQTMKTVMTAEMEVVIREEKFLKEEPDRLENALRRCKKLTGTLVTLKRLASVQEQRHSATHPLPEKSSSADGPHSDGETHATKSSRHGWKRSSNFREKIDLWRGFSTLGWGEKIVDSDSHTVIHVPPDGHQKTQKSETTLDTLLDDLQYLTKVGDAKRDFIPGKSGPQRRLPSYPSADSPVRTPIHVHKTLSTGSQGHSATGSKLQVGMGKRSLSLSPTPSFSDGRTSPYSHEHAQALISSLRKSIEVQESIQQPAQTAQKKVPPPPPPRTTSCSPVASPTNPTSPKQKFDSTSKTYGHMRSNSEPASKSESNIKKPITSRSISASKQDSFDNTTEIVRTSAINDDDTFPREHLSSNSSSSESVNSQEGLQMILHGKAIAKDKKAPSRQSSTDSNVSLEYEENTKKQGPRTPNKMRQELLEQRHQELLKKQKQLQEQYARLQQMQRGQLRFSPPRSGSSTTIGDLKKTGSESNILSKAALSLTPSSGSMTHLAVTSNIVNHTGHTSPSQGISRSPVAKVAQNKIYETDIL